MRSPREIAFRLKQEAVNASRLAHTPRFALKAPLQPARRLPDPVECVRSLGDTPYASEVAGIAESVLAHRFPIFGQTIETGPDIDWRRDYKHEKASGLQFFRRVPYLDFQAVGDHKWVWELNRHQHLIVLAQASQISGRREFVSEIEREITTWIEADPFARGINWASALEVAFRALSWIWVDHLAGDAMNPDRRIALQQALWLHARHLEANLSVYFSPNTHLLGEALALYAIGRIYPSMPGAARFERTGAEIVEAQTAFQVRADGSHFEQSTYYHVYALDMFVLYYLLAGRPARMQETLRVMAAYLDALAGPARRLFASGDDDGGRLFHPYGERDQFCRATLATCANLFPDLGFEYCPEDVHEQAAWWIGPESATSATRSRPRPDHVAFQDSGMLILVCGAVEVLFDCGPLGWGGAGHSHADTLNVLIRRGSDAITNDSGTFTYITDPDARNWFRGTAAHNTIRVDERDQADPVKPFRWDNKPAVRLNASGKNFGDAQCEYRGIVHRRRVLLCDEIVCIVVDDLTGADGDHSIEQFWNIADGTTLATSPPYTFESGWRSDIYGSRTEAKRAVVRMKSPFPVTLVSVIGLGLRDVQLDVSSTNPLIIQTGGILAEFPDSAAPSWRMERH